MANITKQVGKAVRARREQLGMTLRDLATRSKVSASMISDIERGAKSPTISTLAELADALGASISVLAEMPRARSGRIHVVRAAETRSLADPGTGAKRRSFGPAIDGSKVEFLEYVVPPRTLAGPFAAHAKGTIEHLHLAAGTLEVVVADEAVHLSSGDSCSCIADVQHHFDNRTSETPALIYLVVEKR